jgi:hypothetical protein
MPNSVQIKEKEVSIAQKTKAKKLDQQFDKQTIAMQTLYNFKSLNEKSVCAAKFTEFHVHSLIVPYVMPQDPTKINFDASSIETMKHQIELFLLWYTDMWTGEYPRISCTARFTQVHSHIELDLDRY